LSNSDTSQAQQELNKLRQIIDQLSDAVALQHRAIAGTSPGNMVQSYNSMLRLLTQSNLTMEALARGLLTQEKERQQLRAMQEVGAVINSSLHQAEVLNMVMDSIIELTGAERGFLMLRDGDSSELEPKVARNINRETLDGSSFEISRSIVESVAETGEPVVTTNAQADPRFAGQESIISYNLRSILCVALKIKESIIGVIYADNRIVSGIFVDTDRDLLSAFANQAAVAIENTRLFDQIREQLAGITEMKNLQDDVFDSIASGVITIDLNDRISLYNRAAERILGVPGYKVLEQDYRTLLNEPMGNVAEDIIESIQAEGGQRYMELDVESSTQSDAKTLNLSFAPLRDMHQETQGVAMVLDDVSENKRLEVVRRYLPPALVDQLRDVEAVQKPQRREISIVFADIRGFTTISEQYDPEFLIGVLNNHLTVAAAAINVQEGMIDKYDGDTVMALFNAPLNPQEDHAQRAVRTALAIQIDLAEYHLQNPDDLHLYFGIGVHSGDAVVGNVGSPLRKDYSAIGDAVNISKRLQELAKGGQILITQSTYDQVRDLVSVTKLDEVQVKGRQATNQIYQLDGIK